MRQSGEGLREFAARYTEAWCSANPSSVAEFFAEDGSLAINGGAAAAGRASITELARSFMDAFPDLHLAMDDLRANGERMEYHWTLSGTNTGAGGTGRRVRISGFESWRMGDGRLIAESLGYFDEAEYRRQLERGVED